MPLRTIRISVRLQPRASSNETLGFDEAGFLRVRVTAAPVGGKANEALVRLLASELGVSRGAVRVVRGAASRRKLVEVQGVDEARAGVRLSGVQPG